MPSYYCVLSDRLLDAWLNFKKGIITDKNTLEKLLKYIKYPFLAHFSKESIAQISEPSLQQLLLATFPNFKEISLEELADNTLYKIILNNEKLTKPPYYDIDNNKFLENNYVILHKPNDYRQYTYDYLKLLLTYAKNIFIHDKYFSYPNNINSSLNFLNNCLPKSELSIFYTKNTFDKKMINQAKKISPNWQIRPDKTNLNINSNSHDRYLRIDNKLEIILSSGFDGLFSNNKESALIIRELK